MTSGYRTVEEISLGNGRSITIIIPWASQGPYGDGVDGEAEVGRSYVFRDEVTQTQENYINVKLEALGSSKKVSLKQFKDFTETVDKARKRAAANPGWELGYVAWFVTGHDGMAKRVEEAL